VPYVRGRERSREPEAVLAEVRGLVEDGVGEIWLIGQNVNSYTYGFPELLKSCASFDGDYKLRFMTSHPKDAGQPLFDVMASSEHIAPVLHLPVQSGSNAVLKAMNRGYTREEYIAKIKAAKATVPNLVLSSDVIVGFPGETEQDHADTLALLEEVEFAKLFTFQYSARAGTPAAELTKTLPPDVMKRRFMQLLEVQKTIEERRSGGLCPTAL
jgi:tRNA-2-methylthio-N6-dimethylallyladenosine synthase